MYRKILFVLLSVVLCVALSSCSSDDSASEEKLPREVTSQEAQVFARVLNNNKLDKNATFEISSGKVPGTGFRANGVADWENNVVSIKVSLLDIGQVDLETQTSASGVFETFNGIQNFFATTDLETKSWAFRAFNPESFGVDSLAQFVLKLSSEAPDNPILVKQNGAKYLGQDEIEGVKVTKFTNDNTVVYFVDDSGNLLKVNAKIKGFKNDVDVILSKRSESKVNAIDPNDSQPIADYEEIYLSFRPPF